MDVVSVARVDTGPESVLKEVVVVEAVDVMNAGSVGRVVTGRGSVLREVVELLGLVETMRGVGSLED